MVNSLSNEDFLAELSTLLSTRTDGGSVFLTQKRLSYKADQPQSEVRIDDFSDTRTSETFPLLIRASDGGKMKISTIVGEDGMEEFFGKYAEVCKIGMHGLKKRDRKKEKAKKEKKKEKK